MKSYSDLSDTEFENAFADQSLDPELFTHEAHLKLAWLHIQKYGINSALKNIPIQLKMFVAKAGASDKYNHTLTIAAIRIVEHFYNKNNYSTFNQFIANNSRLKTNFKDLINSHYSSDILNSEHAKKIYIQPELLPFDPTIKK